MEGGVRTEGPGFALFGLGEVARRQVHADVMRLELACGVEHLARAVRLQAWVVVLCACGQEHVETNTYTRKKERERERRVLL